MKKKLKRFLTLLLATCMILGTVSISSAEVINPPTPEGNKYAQSKTAEWTDDTKEYADVTLKVGGDSHGSVDVVILLGGGMQANRQTVDSAIGLFEEVMKSETSTVKLGLISLEKGQEIILDLADEEAVLNPDTYEQFITDKFNYINSLPAGTTNLHSQLVEAKRMLDADTTVKPENKYMFVIATGRTYWFDDANGNQATIVGKTSKLSNGSTGAGAGVHYYYGNYTWQSLRGGWSSLYMLPDRYKNDYSAFFKDIEKWVVADGDKYVYSPLFDKNDNEAYEKWYANNSADWRNLYNGGKGTRYGAIIINPKPAAENFITGVVDGILYASNPAHAMNYERAHYESAKAYKAMVDAGYNCYALCSENPNYQNNSEYIKLGAGYTGTSTSQIGHSFMNYLATLGGQKEAPTLWDYERDAEGNMLSTKNVLQEDFFESIKEDIVYTCSAGSYVEDFIGCNKNGDFEFVEDASTMTLTVGSVTYQAAKVDTAKHIDENGEIAKSSYAFTSTAEAAEGPTFWLDYYYGDGKTTERFVWTFGETIYKNAPVSLTYRLKLKDKQELPGTYIVITNNSATFTPVDSDGVTGDEEYFPIPELDYIANGVNINVTKVWDDDSNRDNIRPDNVNVRLYIKNTEILADNDTIDTINGTDIAEVVTLEADKDANKNWKYSWSGLRKFLNGQEIVYAVEEVNDPEVTDNLDKYEASISSETKNNINYITVTNTYKPEETTVSVEKVWDDANNQDGLQPESIQVELSAKLADGKVVAVDTVELNAENEWKHTWTVWKNDAGEAIEYTVRELSLGEGIQEEYTVAVTGGLNDDGETYSYTITNTHVPYVRDISVNKVWEDENNRDGVRPESVTAKLLGLVDGQILIEEIVVLNESNGWGHKWEGLPVNSQGKAIVYTVEEVLDNEVLKNEYTSVVTESEETSGIFTITNTHIPYKTSVTVNKEWVDQDNKYGFRTTNVYVQLLADGEAYGEVVTLNGENNWTYTWNDLYVNKENENGQEIAYTVEEVITSEISETLQLEKYYDVTITDSEDAETTDAEGKPVYNYTITNSLKKTSIVLTKYINKVDPENATSIFRYLITGGPNGDYRANVTINFENGTVKVNGVEQGIADTDLRDNIGFDQSGLSVTIDGLESGDYTIIEYAARGYELVQMSDGSTITSASNGVQNPLKVTAITGDCGEAYYWNRYSVPTDYTAVNRFSVSELGNLSISIKRK